MEELLELRELLIGGNLTDALLLVEEMTEMSKDDKINKIDSFVQILLLHLIKQTAEKRSTRSWEISVKNAVREIQKTNRRRKAGGTYFSEEELRETIDSAYESAVDFAAIEAFGGCYSPQQLAKMVDRTAILEQAIALILSQNLSPKPLP
ncbi:MAG: DUF29 domain-containing protein [Oscillatoriales cyanobacterium SM2_1_8]|nr:DUF29 domain-containing protein [Oscillatoriales cyanobacterium SM2_1_8]